jgi:DNA-binding MarR family transcriptional regulator
MASSTAAKKEDDDDERRPHTAGWTFFTNHAHVLFCLARDPEMRLREVADAVGITERAAQRIVSELSHDGYLQVKREGRRNKYSLVLDSPLRHTVEQGHTVQDLLEFLFAD